MTLTSLLRMQSHVGYSISRTINGHLSIKNLLSVISLPNPRHRGLPGRLGHALKEYLKAKLMPLTDPFESGSLREYYVTLSSGEVVYILAANSEKAAWQALELSEDREVYLVDVRQTDEW